MNIAQNDSANQYNILGKVASWAVFILSAIYLPVLILGLLSLKSPQDPIADPYFSIMELLILLIAPLMVVSMVAVYNYASSKAKAYGLISLVFMILLATITSGVHFVILAVSRQIGAAGFSWAALFFSFKWPSVAYALDILAWDVFFALSMLFAAPVFKKDRLERLVRYLMIGSGVLCLAGLIGVPLANMQIENWFIYRNIGIAGYALVAPVAFLLMGMVFGRKIEQDKKQ